MAEIIKSRYIQEKNRALAHTNHTGCDSLMRYARVLGFGDLHIKIDPKTGLQAIVAVHNLKRGPAIGGCRMVAYETVDQAIEDVLRLARMMSYKAAINNLPHGGGKSVIIKPKVITDRDAYFEKFGDFVNELGGRYITAVDSGTSPKEMDIIARRTPYVTCTSNSGADSDPSPFTALGVRRAIEAAVKFKLGRDSIEGVHVAIQGAGHVGYWLARELHALGARITITDINQNAVQQCVEEMGVATCAPDDIYAIDADVFAPCALGAVINKHTIHRLKARIVAGSANNQLAHQLYADLMHERGILYAPDFLINAGGLIQVAVIYDKGDQQRIVDQIGQMYDTVYEIFEQSVIENENTNYIAERIAHERLA